MILDIRYVIKWDWYYISHNKHKVIPFSPDFNYKFYNSESSCESGQLKGIKWYQLVASQHRVFWKMSNSSQLVTFWVHFKCPYSFWFLNKLPESSWTYNPLEFPWVLWLSSEPYLNLGKSVMHCAIAEHF